MDFMDDVIAARKNLHPYMGISDTIIGNFTSRVPLEQGLCGVLRKDNPENPELTCLEVRLVDVSSGTSFIPIFTMFPELKLAVYKPRSYLNPFSRWGRSVREMYRVITKMGYEMKHNVSGVRSIDVLLRQRGHVRDDWLRGKVF